MRRIQWRDGMSVDRGMIDEDHRHLIDIINRFAGYMARGGGDAAGALDILSALKFYAATHFEREERLQRLAEYPESERHHHEHQGLVATLHDIIARTRAIGAGDASAVADELSLLLRRWLMEHIIQLDLRMKPYADRMRRLAADLPDLRTIRLPAAR
jgi:hemerythrin